MVNLQKRSATSRLFAIIVLFALIPAWFFYIGMQYSKTMSVLKNNAEATASYLKY